MRITNKIMQNNSLYNINNNKVAEDTLNTMMSTGKKITRPSEDPVIAIRALRLRSNVVQLNQYYDKNAKDAESWLTVTADALSTVTAVLTDCVKQATKGASKDLTLDDMETIVTQIDSLAKEYYSTGNVDFAGRYVFTGYRTETPLTFEKATSANYTDIEDEFNAGAIGESNRVNGRYKLDEKTDLDNPKNNPVESTIEEKSVGRLRLSYNKLNYLENQTTEDEEGEVARTPKLMYRETFPQPATSTVTSVADTITVTLTENGRSHYVEVPVSEDPIKASVTCDGMLFTAEKDGDGYIVTGEGESDTYIMEVDSKGTYKSGLPEGVKAETDLESRAVSSITYNNGSDEMSLELPTLPAIDQSYTMKVTGKKGDDDAEFDVTVNSDGTFTVVYSPEDEDDSDNKVEKEYVNVTSNGSIYSSYRETCYTIDNDHIIYSTTSEAEKDKVYEDLSKVTDENKKTAVVWLNAATGEVIFNDYLKNKLSTLPDIINAKTIAVEYDKKEWEKGDIKPEHLFSCTYTNELGKEILYNKGTAPHNIAYDVGFAQSVVVNTTADAAFTTSVKRDAEDLDSMLSEIKQVSTTLKTLNNELAAAAEADKPTIQAKIDAAQKAYDYMRENIQKEFEHKITSMQKALDVANIAVTDNGTRAKRLDLIADRLMTQTTTFETLKSENEDIDLAEAATKLTTAQVTYEASLMATGKISQTSLLNYL